MPASFSRMSSRGYFTTMATPTTYPYNGNYGMYWPSAGQTENQVGGYFDPYRMPGSMSNVTAVAVAGQGYPTHCKYTEADSTQHSAVDPNSHIQHEKSLLVPQEARTPSTATTENQTSVIHMTRPSNSKRKPTPVCDERKDGHYYERRNRNNESAKKSRMNRKQREEQNAFRCLLLERENLRLQQEIRSLAEENKNLQMRCLQFSRN
ncbi:hypothetical protein BV898_02861 [Hypsibius exemplaris]|uniref:BZIP domain-containing protein n=1 Tax=Hypsibius exemplaris TaxID=2072580 RepID=A0A1W0X6K7_HYPEX|nr:hypothetical protein BV898_02861 [Hypsibius exemplaris]